MDAAGRNLLNIGYTMIAGILISLFHIIFVSNIVASSDALELVKSESVVLSLLYFGCAIIIIVNMISAGNNLIYYATNSEKQLTISEKQLIDNVGLYFDTRIGSMIEGGILFFSNDKGEQGLICSLEDLGKANWDDALKLCREYKGGNHSDWRLPTKDELSLICNLLHKRKSNSGFVSDYYWSFTEPETDSNYAWTENFRTGLYLTQNKTKEIMVRAVRSF